MPLVRIDVRKGKDAAYRQAIGRAVYDALVSVGVPENDRFQVVGEHEAGNLLFAHMLLHDAANAILQGNGA